MTPISAAYTSLLVNERGVVLFAQHFARIAAAGPACAESFLAFAASAAPGVYALRACNGQLDIRPRGPSALVAGMPIRYRISPYANEPGPFAKPAPPSRYDEVRAPGIATLLTSLDGRELYESCVASVLAWDGARLVAPPEDRPAVRSAALSALREAGLVASAPLLVSAREPLALVNAVGGVVAPSIPERELFPEQARARIAEVLASSTRRG